MARLRRKISSAQESTDGNEPKTDPTVENISNVNEVQVFAVITDNQKRQHKTNIFKRPFRRKKASEDVPKCHTATGSKELLQKSKMDGDMLRLVKILTMWTELFPYDFQDELVMAQVRSITER